MSGTDVCQIFALIVVESLGFIPVFISLSRIAIGLGDIAGGNLCRSVYAGVGSVFVTRSFSPAKHVYVAEVGTVPDEVEIVGCIRQVGSYTYQVSGTGGCNNHPHHVVVEVVTEPVVAANDGTAVPVGSDMVFEVTVAVVENGLICLVTSCFVCVENHLQGLCLAPSAVDEGLVTSALVLQELLGETVHHAFLHCGGELRLRCCHGLQCVGV